MRTREEMRALGFDIITTDGAVGLVSDGVSVCWLPGGHANLEGEFTAEQLAALADWIMQHGGE